MKDKLKFKITPTLKKAEIFQPKEDGLIETSSIKMQPIIKHFDSICQRLQSTIKSQNDKIEILQSKYSEAMLGKFDKLIAVNQKIGKNLQKVLQKFERENQVFTAPSLLLPPLKVSPRTSMGFRARTSRKLLKSHFEEQKEQKQQPVKHSKKSINILQIPNNNLNTLAVPSEKQNQIIHARTSIINSAIQKLLLSPRATTNKFVYSEKCPQALNQIFKNIVQYNYEEETIQIMMNKLLGTFFQRTAEHYYQQYSSGKISYTDLKIRFSTDIMNQALDICAKWLQFLSNQTLLKLPQECSIKGKDFFRLFDAASLKSLEYLIHKYPPSRAKQIDTQLIQKIKQVKSYSIVKYDLLRNAKMQFGNTKGQSDFSVEIKSWINALIKQSKSQFPKFKETMKAIFNNNQGSLDGSKIEGEVQYLIGSKIPENTQLYTQQQINSPGLPIKNPEILRILVKWYEDLKSNFSNTKQKILQNRFGFKTSKHNTIPIRIPHSRLEVLAEKLKMIYQTQLKPVCKEQFTHIGAVMQGLIAISSQGIQGYQFLDQREATIVKMAQCLNQTFKSYILMFLNNTIEKLVKVRSLYQQNVQQSSINLISFNILDLLRCKCTGTKQQIYRIYNQILANKQYFEVIRVKNKLNEPTRDILINLKLKDSFLICEVQLSLGSSQQDVNDHFCHYLYELERSGFGVMFQCASQIANLDPRISYMVKHKDLRFKKITKLSQKLKQRIRIDKDAYCSTMHQEKVMQLMPSIHPFCCVICNSFIDANQNLLPYLRCETCQICICSQCVGSYTSRDSRVMVHIFKKAAFKDKCFIPHQFFQQKFIYAQNYQKDVIEQKILKALQTQQYAILCIADKVQFSQLIYKKYKSSIVETFTTIPQIPHLNICTEPNTKALCCIAFFNKSQKRRLSDIEGYMKYHLTMGWWKLQQILLENKIEQVICIVDQTIKSVLIVDIIQAQKQIQAIKTQKQIEVRICNLNKTKGNYLEVTSKHLQDISPLKYVSKKQDIEILNLWQNNIKDITLLTQFPNIQQLFLQDNDIQSISPIVSLKKLQLLILGQNNISGSLPLMNMPNLQFAMLGRNQIEDINNLQYSDIPNIVFIKLYFNKIQEVPLLKFQKLQAIMLNNCNINNLQKLSKSDLPNLSILDVSHNYLTGNLIAFNFPKLAHLGLTNNQIKSLHQFSKSNIPNLKILKLSHNQIEEKLVLPQVTLLKQLHIDHNKITCVKQIFSNRNNFNDIQMINLQKNLISQKLPILDLPSLQVLNFSYNQLTDISNIEISSLSTITQINISHNKIIGELPKIQLINLQKIDLSFNQFQNIHPIKYWRGPQLIDVKLNNNKLQGQLKCLQLYALQKIDLSFNQMINEEYIQNIHLTPLIQCIDFSNNSQELRIQIQNKYGMNQNIMKKIKF